MIPRLHLSFRGLLLTALLSACAASQHPSEGGLLAEAPSREQVRAVVSVEWERLFARGTQLAEEGDLTRAEQYLSGALLRGGPPERVLPRLLRVCVGAQRFRAAVEYARPYLERHPEAWALRFLVASIHSGLGEPHSARRHLELVLQYNPRHAEAHYTLALILRDDLGDPAGADVHFREYLQLEPEGSHAAEARAGLLTPVRPQ